MLIFQRRRKNLFKIEIDIAVQSYNASKLPITRYNKAMKQTFFSKKNLPKL